jgi:hypothetical protein
VTWTNTDDALHTVTSESGTGKNVGAEFDSGMMAAGKIIRLPLQENILISVLYIQI